MEFKSGISQQLLHSIKSLLVLNKPNRPWHVALVATISMGIPALVGVYLVKWLMQY